MHLDTRESIIQTAEYFLRSKGYAAFSYADLEKRIGIRKASIHYHFSTKEELGLAVVEASIARLAGQCEKIEADFPDALDRIHAFVKLFSESMVAGVLPLCGALAAEMAVLPEKMESLTTRYFQMELQWLEQAIESAMATGEIPTSNDASQKAYEVLSLLEGSSFVSWALKSKGGLSADVVSSILSRTSI